MTRSRVVRGGRSVEFAHRVWPADPRRLVSIRMELRRWLAPLPLAESTGQDLVLAVTEAATNVIQHAYPHDHPRSGDPTVALSFWTDDRSVNVEIVDRGRWRLPADTGIATPGFGLLIMHRMVESVAIHVCSLGTRVLLTQPVPGGSYPGGPAAGSVGGGISSVPPTTARARAVSW